VTSGWEKKKGLNPGSLAGGDGRETTHTSEESEGVAHSVSSTKPRLRFRSRKKKKKGKRKKKATSLVHNRERRDVGEKERL